MINSTIETMKDTLKMLKVDVDDTQDIDKLMREHNNAQKVIADLTKKIDELTVIESYDAANIGPEILNLKELRTTAEGKLSLIDEALTTARTDHKTAYDEYSKIKAGIETLTDLSTNNFQKMVDDIQTPQA